jgi:pimeloyl-ACP methyl ester carboxylesterase
MPFLESGSARLFYTIDDHTDAWTKPDTVVFVHGFTENTEAWRAWVPHFSRRYRMIRYDQRGFGQTGPVAKDFPLTTDVVVGDLAALIKSVASSGPVHVVGGKSGGIPVMMLAVKHPELVKTITVACSPVTPPKAAGWIEEMETKGMRAWAYRTQRDRFGSQFPEAGIDWWSDLMGGTAVSTAHAYLRWVGAIDIREDIKRIRCPTLVIGTDTPHRGKGVFEGWQKTIPGSELALIPVDGYHAAGTAPDETARVTLDFIARHAR